MFHNRLAPLRPIKGSGGAVSGPQQVIGALLLGAVLTLTACAPGEEQPPSPTPSATSALTSTPTPTPTLALASTLTPSPTSTATATATHSATPTATETFELSPEGVPAERTLFLAGGDPITLDPAVSKESRSHAYVSQLFSGLVRIDEDLRIQPDLAEAWTVKDETIYTFTLREGVRFHDGKPITAEDFRYSIERATDPALGSPTTRTYLGDIVGVSDKLEGRAAEVSGVEVLDSRTVRITIDGPKAYFLAKLTYPTAAVVDRANVAAGGLDWWRVPNGSGPFRLGAWEEGEYLVLVRHGGYLPSPSKLEFAVFRILSGVPTRMYEAGTVDVASVSRADVARVQDPANGLFDQLTIFPNLSVSYVGFNAGAPPFSDPQVRRAFAMAIDRQRMVKVVYHDAVEQATGILPPGMPACDPDLAGIPFDPEEAKRLIEGSTYGSPEALPPVVFTTAGLGGLSSSVAFLLDSWRQNLGVEVQVHQLTPDTYFYRLSEEVDHLFNYGWNADYPDPENFLDVLFHSAHPENNPGGYSNPNVDTLLVEARTEREVTRRMQLYQQVEQLLMDDTAAVPIYHDRDYVLIKPYVKGFVISGVSIPVLTNVELLPR